MDKSFLFRIIKLEVIYIIFLVNILFTYVKITSKRRLIKNDLRLQFG